MSFLYVFQEKEEEKKIPVFMIFVVIVTVIKVKYTNCLLFTKFNQFKF